MAVAASVLLVVGAREGICRPSFGLRISGVYGPVSMDDFNEVHDRIARWGPKPQIEGGPEYHDFSDLEVGANYGIEGFFDVSKTVRLVVAFDHPTGKVRQIYYEEWFQPREALHADFDVSTDFLLIGPMVRLGTGFPAYFSMKLGYGHAEVRENSYLLPGVEPFPDSWVPDPGTCEVSGGKLVGEFGAGFDIRVARAIPLIAFVELAYQYRDLNQLKNHGDRMDSEPCLIDSIDWDFSGAVFKAGIGVSL